MRRLIKKIVPCFHAITASFHGYKKPHFECREKARSLDLEVFVPGVESDDVELAVSGGELVVTARKALRVRHNFQSANFEAVQQDYQLRVQLRDQIDPQSIWAALRNGILTIHFRKTASVSFQLSVA